MSDTSEFTGIETATPEPPAEAPESSEAEAPTEAETEPQAEAEAPARDSDEDGPVPLPELEAWVDFERSVKAAIDAQPIHEGELYTGTVVEVGEEYVTVDIGHERTGTVDRDELIGPLGTLDVEVGDEIDVYLHRETAGGIELSKEMADRLRMWEQVAEAAKAGTPVEGTILGRTKGGLVVDVGVKAFLPGSQVDVRPTRNVEQYFGKSYRFKIIRFDRKRGNAVVSRREILDSERAGMKEETLAKLQVGATVTGVVKNLTDFGCFIDLGGLDGLLHVTDMSWGRVTHPRQVVTAGQEIEVQVLRIENDGERVSLGLKQLQDDPWLAVAQKYQVGQRFVGKVVSVAEFGAFVEIEDGIEGLVHVSEMSWTKRVTHAKNVVKKGDEIETVILGIDNKARRISLGLKQAQPNPWSVLQERYPLGARIRAKIRNVTNFGVFLGIEEGIDGLIHVSDLSWGGKIKDPRDVYEKGQELDAVVLHIDVDGQRLSLGHKQLGEDPWRDAEHRFPVGRVVTGKVTKLLDFGAIVQITDEIEGLVHISEIAEERVEDISTVLEVGKEVRAKVLRVEPEQRRMGLSIKRLAEHETSGDYAGYTETQASRPTTIGDLIKERMNTDLLPPGKPVEPIQVPDVEPIQVPDVEPIQVPDVEPEPEPEPEA